MFSVISFNINSIRARLHIVQQIIENEKPDVLLLQEIKMEKIDELIDFFHTIGYNITAIGQKSYNGVAIVSKSRAEDVIKGLPTFAEDPNARFIQAVIDNTLFINVYMPNGQDIGSEKFFYKMEWTKKFSEYIETVKGEYDNIVIAGDFNIVLASQDVYDEKIIKNLAIYSDEAKKFMTDWTADGWTNIFRFLYPTKNSYTWWSYRNTRRDLNKGICLDYFLTTKNLVGKVRSMEILTEYRLLEKPSDHTPIKLTLDI
ncbi:MAG: exodeoxyribonuclease III [Alphaproteobacteria bacterium]|nr:exodeoxyribonuclease III [Alphaproteobacteria bacterium]